MDNITFHILLIGLSAGLVSGLIAGFVFPREEQLGAEGIVGLSLFISLSISCIVLSCLLGGLLGYRILGIFVGATVVFLVLLNTPLGAFPMALIYVPPMLGLATFEGENYSSLLVSLRTIVARLIIARTKTFPWNYCRCLDYATERILLRKIGPNYIFIHQLLLEHFAELYHSTTTGRETSDSNCK